MQEYVHGVVAVASTVYLAHYCLSCLNAFTELESVLLPKNGQQIVNNTDNQQNTS